MTGGTVGAWQRPTLAFTAAAEPTAGLPLPGSGATWGRWAVFAEVLTP
jgi:hypothetical protein